MKTQLPYRRGRAIAIETKQANLLRPVGIGRHNEHVTIMTFGAGSCVNLAFRLATRFLR